MESALDDEDQEGSARSIAGEERRISDSLHRR